MKLEKFIGTFFILNIIMLVAVAFVSKNDLMLTIMEDIFYTESKPISYLETPPKGLAKNSEDKPYQQAKAIIKSFGNMGDGKCLTGLGLGEKLRAVKENKGCSKDYAEVFDILAEKEGINSRIVKNDSWYANEIYSNGKWVFIDAYYAMSATDENANLLSYLNFSEKMLNNGKMAFKFFGGKNHCLSGKPLENHPYYGDKSKFAHIYTPISGDTEKSIEAEKKYAGKFKAFEFLKPYSSGKSEWARVSISSNDRDIIKKYVLAGMLVWVLTFIGTNIVLPVSSIILWLRSRSR